MADNFCKDCKHLMMPAYMKYRCTSVDCGAKLDPVTGEDSLVDCYKARSDKGACGAEGKYWEEKRK